MFVTPFLHDWVGQSFLIDIVNDRQECLSTGLSINTGGRMENQLKITRRHLPHWTLEGSIYFVTFCLNAETLNTDEQRIVLEHIKEGDGKFYDCYAAVVMPDHVHLLIRLKDGISLTRVMNGIKGVSAHKINLHRKIKGKVWQHESYDRIVRDGNEFDAKLKYMYNNPVKKGLTEEPENYIGWYYNKKFLG
jgi:putative transposase